MTPLSVHPAVCYEALAKKEVFLPQKSIKGLNGKEVYIELILIRILRYILLR